ncbi:AlpA family transcriptional regulator [Salipiger sp. HF18]|uniref:helix-turn-helix transcriptional regulator n=1 Tax=Salipiger sp. HF18 TaxID=2721557 RepID=UPI0020CADBBE|nr:helix-turn-helix domain-containing protein [Salipiger sp. HF18]
MKRICLKQKELAERWTISHRTLERWRWAGEGPAYMKIGGSVVYRVADIEAFVRDAMNTTSDQNVPVYWRRPHPPDPGRRSKALICDAFRLRHIPGSASLGSSPENGCA